MLIQKEEFNFRDQLNKLIKVVPPPGMAQEDWKILRAISEELGQKLPYDTLEEVLLLNQVRYRMAELAPHLLKYDHIEPTYFGSLALKPIEKTLELNETPITDYIDVDFFIQNFYMMNAISRSSPTMAKCSTAFNHEKFSHFRTTGR